MFLAMKLVLFCLLLNYALCAPADDTHLESLNRERKQEQDNSRNGTSRSLGPFVTMNFHDAGNKDIAKRDIAERRSYIRSAAVENDEFINEIESWT